MLLILTKIWPFYFSDLLIKLIIKQYSKQTNCNWNCRIESKWYNQIGGLLISLFQLFFTSSKSVFEVRSDFSSCSRKWGWKTMVNKKIRTLAQKGTRKIEVSFLGYNSYHIIILSLLEASCQNQNLYTLSLLWNLPVLTIHSKNTGRLSD